MTIFICFMIAITLLYIMKLFTHGFNSTELLSFFIMIVLLGSHVYLSTRKKAIYGIIVPVFIIGSFYPVYRLIEPVGMEFFLLIALYVIALGCSLAIWHYARKNIHS